MNCPEITFRTSRVMHQFCHMSVLYADQLPDELASGMLGNKTYQTEKVHLRKDRILQIFRDSEQISTRVWYSLARGVMKSDKFDEVLREQKGDTFLDIVRDGGSDYDSIWEDIQARIREYEEKFASLWNPFGDRVLSNLSSLSKREWEVDEILVHFVDCLWGGFAWVDSIAFTPFPDMEVQKKFLAHELSELITPSGMVETRLVESGFDGGISHTVVDMIAYFSVKDFIQAPVLPNPERKGIKPNQNYYPAVDVLYPLFEQYSQDPSSHENFTTLVEEMILKLKESQIQLQAS